MEEQKKKNKKIRAWLKENYAIVGVTVLSAASILAEGYFLLKTKKDCDNLTNENIDLKGQIRALERENKRLGREIENSYYQLGKKSIK